MQSSPSAITRNQVDLPQIHQLEEITKQDVRIEYVKLPIGQRFDQAILNADEGGSAPPGEFYS